VVGTGYDSMIIDARSLGESDSVETDVCIVGGGVAGITLAREFIGQRLRVTLLERGGWEPDEDTQSLGSGDIVGHPYIRPLDSAHVRCFCFGGSSTQWELGMDKNQSGARMRPLDEIDFQERSWVPHSGWPFDKSHLDPFYARAQSICQIGPPPPEDGSWVEDEKNPYITDRVRTAIFRLGPRDAFRGYCREIIRAQNITTYLHANVTEIESNETAQTVTRVRVACNGGRNFSVSAKWFILASGGIEIPRLLLVSNKTLHAGLGNQNGLVGRFFMEHLHLWSGVYTPSKVGIFNSSGLFRQHKVNGGYIQRNLTLDQKVLCREQLLNHSVIGARPWPEDVASHGHESIVQAAYNKVRRKLRRIRYRINPSSVKVFRLKHMAEQSPNPDSRVILSSDRDTFGMNRVKLDWQISPMDIRSMIRVQEILDAEFRRAGLGHLNVELEGVVPPSKPDMIGGGMHHMGTTRMNINSKMGVVNENCQVHGVDNLYIAGPSVFPTAGYANPTITIVALAARLADHIKQLDPRPAILGTSHDSRSAVLQR